MVSPAEKRFFITGGGGFAGYWLARRLAAAGGTVTVFDQHPPPAEEWGFPRKWMEGDVRSRPILARALAEARPQVIYHLAGIAFVPEAERRPGRALAVNVVGGLNLFAAVRETVPQARVLVVSSSVVYGRPPAEAMPLPETAPVRPASFYAFTKAALENGAHLAAASGLEVIVLRPFNHIGPRQSSIYVTAAFARQVAEAECGKAPPVIRVGNLDPVRDFTDVEDMVEAYLLAGTRPLRHDLYNLCSSRGVAIREVLEHLVRAARRPIRVEVDPDRVRVSDLPVLVGDNTRFSGETGWSPRIPLEESLRRILGYWRGRCAT